MSNGTNHVEPGDIIRVEDWNELVDQFQELENRVNDLEGITNPHGVAIYRPDPSDTLVIGDALRIVGRNFGLPTQNVVLLDRSIRIASFGVGSNDRLLIIPNIPNVQNVPEDGRLVPLTVSNPFGSANTWFHLRQPELTIPTGTLDVTLVTTPEGEVFEAGGTYLFEYRIRARTSMDEVYELTPDIDIGWLARVVDEAGTPVEPQEVFIAEPEDSVQGEIVTVHVEMRIPDGTPDETAGVLTLLVTSKRNPEGLFKLSDEAELIVGSDAPPAESLGLSLGSVFAPGRKEVRNGREVIIVPATGQEVAAEFRVGWPVVESHQPDATYSITGPTLTSNPDGLWASRVEGQTNGLPWEPPTETFFVVVSGQSGAGSTSFQLRIERDDDSSIFGTVDQIVDVEMT